MVLIITATFIVFNIGKENQDECTRAQRNRCALHDLCQKVRSILRQPEADGDGVVYPIHESNVQLAHALFQPPFVNGADLL